MEAMEKSALEDPNKSFQIRKVIECTDSVAVLSRLQPSKVDLGYAVVHILKFEGGKIAEMWEVVQEIPEESPNELGMF
jgi:Predicted ester cyclase